MVIVLADVVARDGAYIPDIFGAGIAGVADEKKSAVVVVAVVVLDERVAAVPIGVEAFAVVLAARSISLVELDDGVVGAP